MADLRDSALDLSFFVVRLVSKNERRSPVFETLRFNADKEGALLAKRAMSSQELCMVSTSAHIHVALGSMQYKLVRSH